MHQLCNQVLCVVCQDYRWWWRTFLVSGGSAFYVLIYAIFYFVNKVTVLSVSLCWCPLHFLLLFIKCICTRGSFYVILASVH